MLGRRCKETRDNIKSFNKDETIASSEGMPALAAFIEQFNTGLQVDALRAAGDHAVDKRRTEMCDNVISERRDSP